VNGSGFDGGLPGNLLKISPGLTWDFTGYFPTFSM